MAWTVTSGTEYSTGPQTVTITIATPAVCSAPNNFQAGDIVVFTTTGALPSHIPANTPLYVIATGLTQAAFEVSLTPGGAAINTTGDTQSGTHTVQVESIITSDTTNSTFYFQLDTSAIASITATGVCADLIEARIYTYDTGQTTYIQTWKAAFQFQQINNQKASPFVPSDAGIRLTLKQLAIALPATTAVTFTASNANITLTNTLKVGDTVFFSGTTAPTGLSFNTSYYVVAVTGTNFQVSATAGGAAIVPTSTGTAVVMTLVGRPYPWKLLKQ